MERAGSDLTHDEDLSHGVHLHKSSPGQLLSQDDFDISERAEVAELEIPLKICIGRALALKEFDPEDAHRTDFHCPDGSLTLAFQASRLYKSGFPLSQVILHTLYNNAGKARRRSHWQSVRKAFSIELIIYLLLNGETNLPKTVLVQTKKFQLYL